jgi:hypothetical protein
MGNLPYDRRREFYGSLEDALAPGGVFVDKVLTHPMPNLLLAPLLEKFERCPPNWIHVNEFSCEVLFCSELLDLDQEVNTTRFYEILDGCCSPRIRAFCRRAKVITPMGCRWFYGKPWTDLEASYCPRLRRVAIHEDDEGSVYYLRVKHFVSVRE